MGPGEQAEQDTASLSLPQRTFAVLADLSSSCSSARIESTSAALAVARDGTLFTWGYGEMAQLGHGRQQDEEAPRAVQDKLGNKLMVVTAAAGAQHTVIIVK
jgi:alpha-tubulin suppressor-like RCC1 family protein